MTKKKGPVGCRLFIPWPKFLAGHGAMPHTRKEISLTLSQETLQTQSLNYIRSRLKNSSPGSQTLEHFSQKTRWLAFQWISLQQDCQRAHTHSLFNQLREGKGSAWVPNLSSLPRNSLRKWWNRKMPKSRKHCRLYSGRRQCVYYTELKCCLGILVAADHP